MTLSPANRFDTVGEASSSATGGSTLTGSASANNKGSYVELSSSIPFGVSGVLIQTNFGTLGDALIDIALGAAGSEIVIWSNLLATAQKLRGGSFYVPLVLPAGQRLSARCQHTSSSGSVQFQITLIGAGGGGFQRVEPCGAATGDSGGVSVEPGAVAHTKGAYSELIAATAFAYKWAVLAIGGQNNAIRSTSNWLVDLAVGAAASEQIIVPDLLHRCDGNGDDGVYPPYWSFPISIPAGSRVAVRAQAETTDATDRIFDAVLYGLG